MVWTSFFGYKTWEPITMKNWSHEIGLSEKSWGKINQQGYHSAKPFGAPPCRLLSKTLGPFSTGTHALPKPFPVYSCSSFPSNLIKPFVALLLLGTCYYGAHCFFYFSMTVKLVCQESYSTGFPSGGKGCLSSAIWDISPREVSQSTWGCYKLGILLPWHPFCTFQEILTSF